MKLYRYEDRVYSTVSISVSGFETYGTTEPVVELREFEVLRETPKGYWIEKYGAPFTDQRWVSKRPRAYAHPTKEAALASFIARKRRQAGIHEARAQRARKAEWLGEQLQEQTKKGKQ